MEKNGKKNDKSLFSEFCISRQGWGKQNHFSIRVVFTKYL